MGIPLYILRGRHHDHRHMLPVEIRQQQLMFSPVTPVPYSGIGLGRPRCDSNESEGYAAHSGTRTVPYPGKRCPILQPIPTDGEMESESPQLQHAVRENKRQVRRQRTNLNSEGKDIVCNLQSCRNRNDVDSESERESEGTEVDA